MKTRNIALMLLTAAMLFACGKEDETNPTPANPAGNDPTPTDTVAPATDTVVAMRKVASIVTEVYEYEEGSRTYTTTFQWAGDKVMSVRRDGRDHARFIYDGDLLWQVLTYGEEDGYSWTDTITLYREGGLVTMEVATMHYVEHPATTGGGETRLVRELDTLLCTYEDGKMSTMRFLGEYGSIYRLEWAGGNLSKLMFDAGNEYQELSGLTYDTRHNPFAFYDWGVYTKSYMFVEGGIFCFMSANNLESCTIITLGEDDEPIHLEYTYDGDWPRTMTCYLSGKSTPDWKLTITYED